MKEQKEKLSHAKPIPTVREVIDKEFMTIGDAFGKIWTREELDDYHRIGELLDEKIALGYTDEQADAEAVSGGRDLSYCYSAAYRGMARSCQSCRYQRIENGTACQCRFQSGLDLRDRVLRSGSWNDNNPNNFRSTNRNNNEPDNRNNNSGFRCASAPLTCQSSVYHGEPECV